MEWVKLSTKFYLDPAVASLPDADSELLFVRSLAHAGAEETGGFIDETIVPTLVRRRRYRTAVEALVARSLWVPSSGDRGQPGYRIARWEDWQEELEALARRRAADRDRKRRQRQARKNSQVNGVSRDVSADSHGTRPHPPPHPPLIETDPENPPNPPPSGGNTRCQRHKARPKPWCDDCQKPPVIRPDSKTLAEALAAPACPHGAPNGVACALCRRGIAAEDTA